VKATADRCIHGRSLASRRSNPCQGGHESCSTHLGDTRSLLTQDGPTISHVGNLALVHLSPMEDLLGQPDRSVALVIDRGDVFSLLRALDPDTGLRPTESDQAALDRIVAGLDALVEYRVLS
jgi:hypothetical protein